MKDLEMIKTRCVLIVAGLLMMQQLDVATAWTMQQTCQYIPDGFIADPNDCQSYGYCKNQQFVGTRKCPQNSYYNPNDGTCGYTKECRFNVGSMCKEDADYTLFPDPDNCTQYIYCEDGSGVTGACPAGQIFDSIENNCNYPTEATSSCVAKSICRLVQNKVFAADPDKCGNFIYCQYGTGISKPCPNDKNNQATYYNPASQGCLLSKTCAGESTNTGNQIPAKPDASKCTTAGMAISDEATCYGYFKCTENKEVGDWMKCPPRTHFNPNSQECVTPYTYPCKYDRCGNMMNINFMGAVTPENCVNYLTCVKNTYYYYDTDPAYKGKPCDDGYFFNEFAQQCVKTNPAIDTNYKLCPNVAAPPPPVTG